MSKPTLDLLILDTHNPYTLGVADFSVYPAGFTVVSPTLQVAPPGFPSVAFPFTAKGISVINSHQLGLTREGSATIKIPDGLYRLKYTVNPAYENSVERTFFRVEALLEKLDDAWMRTDFAGNDNNMARRNSEILEKVERLMHEAMAAANQCAATLATNLYTQASKLLDRYLNESNSC